MKLNKKQRAELKQMFSVYELSKALNEALKKVENERLVYRNQ